LDTACSVSNLLKRRKAIDGCVVDGGDGFLQEAGLVWASTALFPVRQLRAMIIAVRHTDTTARADDGA